MTEPTQEMVPFEGGDILTFIQDGKHYIAIRPICDTFSIDWHGQRQRIHRDELLSSTEVIIPSVGADGRRRDMVCLPLEAFPMWLARIDTRRVKDPKAREMILAYQRDATRVLYEHYFGPPKTPESPRFLPDQIEATREWVPFQGTDILVFIQEGMHYVAIKPLCELFGMSWEYHRQRIHQEELLNSTIRVIRTVGADGKRYDMVCLPVDSFIIWLERIRTYRVINPQARALIQGYQRGAPRALHEHILGPARAPYEAALFKDKYIALLEQHVEVQSARRRRRHYKVADMPEDIFKQVNAMIVVGKTYQYIVEFLQERGYQISHSAIGRYAKGFLESLMEEKMTGEA